MSSDEEVQVKSKKGKKTDKQTEYLIKPSALTPKLDTSDWPLLLKVKPNIISIFILELRQIKHQDNPLHSSPSGLVSN